MMLRHFANLSVDGASGPKNSTSDKPSRKSKPPSKASSNSTPRSQSIEQSVSSTSSHRTHPVAAKPGRISHERSPDRPKKASDPVKEKQSRLQSRGLKQASDGASQPGSGYAGQGDGIALHTPPSGPGKAQEKGKGKARWPVGTTPFPSLWGFGRSAAMPAAHTQHMTLLQLLSCRQLESFKPHPTELGKPLSVAQITNSADFQYQMVQDKCGVWEDFSISEMLNKFPFLNKAVPVPEELGPESPGFVTHNEAQLHSSLDSHLFRYLRQYLRITFRHLHAETQNLQASPLTIRDGFFMDLIRGKKPDFGAYNLNARSRTDAAKSFRAKRQPVNRMIIEVKPSSKWDPYWWNLSRNERTAAGEQRPIDEAIFFTPLAQINYYMAHSGADYAGPLYGVILTDKYLVPIKRVGSVFGALLVGEPIPWSRHFDAGEEISDFTVQSALWYMCMLASLPDWHYNEQHVDWSSMRTKRTMVAEVAKREK